ncbi:MAG TPA: hypothetical protein VGE52_00945, partial [Pirellulales bacterium]
MRSRVACLVIFGAAWLGAICASSGPASAQPGPMLREGEAAPAAGAGVALEEAPTKILYARDAVTNKLVPIVGFTLQEFDRMLNVARQAAAAAPKPATSLDSLDVRGTLDGPTAKLEATVAVTVEQAGWVRIPLAFGEAVLDAASCDGDVQSHFVFEDDGYACWIRDPAAAEKPVAHTLKLTLLARIETIGVEQRLALTTPRCTRSNIVLNAPGANVRARSSDAVRLDPKVAS